MIRIAAFMLLLFLSSGAVTGQAQEPNAAPGCEALEVIREDAAYSRLVCRGIREADAGRYIDAIASFQSALRLNLNEVPNFRLLPRLAKTYWEAGDTASARETLSRARAAMMVLAGVYKCGSGDRSPLVNSWGDSVSTPHAAEIDRRMCGPAYEAWYHRGSLEAFVKDAELVRFFLEVERTIH